MGWESVIGNQELVIGNRVRRRAISDLLAA
jgi:hypothetical protein